MTLQLDDRLEKELISNLLAYLLLKTVEMHAGQSYGYQMKQDIEQHIGKQVPEGTLYPLLAKLADKTKYNCLESFVERVNNRPRRYYTLTPVGKKQLYLWPKKWNDIQQVITRVLTDVGGKKKPLLESEKDTIR